MKKIELITEYPLFLPSDKLADKGRENWSKNEAKDFFNWYISEIPNRVSMLLEYLEMDKVHLQTVNSSIIPNLDEKVFKKLKESKALTELNENGIIVLTNEGYAFLTDVASLFSYILLNKIPRLEFTIATGKSNVYYNWPILKDKEGKRGGESFIIGDINSFYRRKLNGVENITLSEFYNILIKNRFRYLQNE